MFGMATITSSPTFDQGAEGFVIADASFTQIIVTLYALIDTSHINGLTTQTCVLLHDQFSI